MISVSWSRTGRDGQTQVHAANEGSGWTICTQSIPEGATVGGMLEVTCEQCRNRKAYKRAHTEKLQQIDQIWKELGV